MNNVAKNKTARLRVNKVSAYQLPNGELFLLRRDAIPHAFAHKLDLKRKRAEKRIHKHLKDNELNVSKCMSTILLLANEVRTYVNFHPHTANELKELAALTNSEIRALDNANNVLHQNLRKVGLDDIHVLDFLRMYRKDILLTLDLHKTAPVTTKAVREGNSIRRAA